jgi:hypothetical protein
MRFELWMRRGSDGGPEYHLLAPDERSYAAERARLGAQAELLHAFEADGHGDALKMSDDFIRRRFAEWLDQTLSAPDADAEGEDHDRVT